jgi:hypothetical protein
MTIYHVGTEDIHFVQAGGAVVITSTAGSPHFRSDWVRCALGSTWFSFGDGSETFWRGPLDHMTVSTGEFWLTCRLYQAATQGAMTDLIGFNEGATRRLSVLARPGQNPILYRHEDGTTDDPTRPLGTTRFVLANGILPMFAQDSLGRIDIYVNLGTGAFKLYLDHALALTFSGDLLNGAFSEINSYDLLGSNGNAQFSEVCWRSDDTRKIIGVRAVWPYGDGNTQDWTGVKEDVDEAAVDEEDANYTDTPSLLQQYTIPPLPSGLTENTIVGAVMLGARMATNPTDEAVNIRTGGSDFNSTTFDTDNAIEDRMYIWPTNPDTSAPFTIDEVNDADFNIGVASV